MTQLSGASVAGTSGAAGMSNGVQDQPQMAQQLQQKYPSRDNYVQKYAAAADKALAGGYLL